MVKRAVVARKIPVRLRTCTPVRVGPGWAGVVATLASGVRVPSPYPKNAGVSSMAEL